MPSGKRIQKILTGLSLLILVSIGCSGADDTGPYARWKAGPPSGRAYFPIGVWLQDPGLAGRYKEAGINLYVGLWRGPTQVQIDTLKKYDMPVICAQNAYAIKHPEEKTIIGWMHGDEPDNAQSIVRGWAELQGEDVTVTIGGNSYGQWGPPVPPDRIISDYRKISAVDPTRPVLLNLGQAVAWDGYPGRGVRRNHPEDYKQYVQGCDIASFDVYPVVHSNPRIAGNLWYVAEGVKRLKQWAGADRPVWNCIETTHISSHTAKPTPHDVRAEVWMSIIHGSRGLIYFVHEWYPRQNAAALLDDPAMLSAVTGINHRIADLAPVINSAGRESRGDVSMTPAGAQVAYLATQYGGATYIFAVDMRGEGNTVTFTVNGAAGDRPVEVLGEDRTLNARKGVFRDAFRPYDVHLYKIRW